MRLILGALTLPLPGPRKPRCSSAPGWPRGSEWIKIDDDGKAYGMTIPTISQVTLKALQPPRGQR